MAVQNPQPRVAGRYVVLEQLGQGGMGSVHRVQDERTGRICALKQLSPKAAADAMVAGLFEREFHTLSELAHPAIIEVYDYGIDEGRAYYTMELLAGADLCALGKVHWRRACELLRDLASSLAILHSRRLLHCDVSPRNVQCTSDGRAKLLDFGAMVPMGVAKRIVGTPPFIAPEMLNLQTLDGRTDLYAFGGLAYVLLTGHFAYPARDLSQLRDLWRRPVAPPVQLVPEIPAALSELVIELIQINRNARPVSAGVVMERICRIAGLPFEESSAVASAYLATPSLVGRDRPLAQARERLVSTLQGRGGVLVASAARGGGRSRFLDACVLEAKLLGLQVVRIDQTDAERGAYGAANALCRQLFEIAPAAANAAVQLHGGILAHIVGTELAGAPACEPAPDRAQILAALRDFGLSVARGLRLMIAVDDAEHIDDATAGLLVALGQKAAKRPLCIALAIETGSSGSAALDILLPLALQIELAPLTESETEQLLGAVFGNAHNLFMVARRLHAIARGNPRATMQLASHLVSQGIARYEAGSFTLPERLDERDLPTSLAAALQARARELDADGLELGQILSLTDPSELSPAAYVELTSHGDRARTYRAIDQLQRAQVLEAQAERFRLSDPTWAAVLTQSLTSEQRVAANARLAKVFEETGTLTRRTHHLLESDQGEAAIRLMLAQFIKDPNEPRDPLADYVPGLIDQIERAAMLASSLDLPAPLRIELRMKLAGASQFLGDVPRFLRTAPETLRELTRDSGLDEYNALDPDMEPMARLTEALTRVQQRYEAVAAEKSRLSPIEAIRELARCSVMFAGVAATSQDTPMMDGIPSLAPFVPLSPAVSAINQFIEITRLLSQAREDEVRELLPPFIARLAQPDRAGLGELYNTSLRMGALYMIGLMDATDGVPNATEHLAAFETSPGHRLNAQRVHMACQLMQGNVEAALAAQRNADLVMLQDGQQQRYPGTTMRPELLAVWLSEDIHGLKRLSERLASMVKSFPNWKPLSCVARCVLRQLQGDAAGALTELEPAFLLAKPRRHRDWNSVATAHVQVLTALGRSDEALEVGRSYMQICQVEKIAGYRRVAQATAEALIAQKSGAEAAALADGLLEHAKARGVRGLALGALYELRARAATAMGDDDVFIDYAQRCASEYQPDRNPAIAARYQRLFRDAQRLRPGAQPIPAPIELPPSAEAGMATVHSRLLECDDASSRAQCVLTILAENTNAHQAYLYTLRGGRPEFVCALPEAAAPAALPGIVEQWFMNELSETPRSRRPIALPAPAQANDVRSEVIEVSGRRNRLHSVVLRSVAAGQKTIVGIAALDLHDDQLQLPEPWLVEALATALLDNDDVDPATCFV